MIFDQLARALRAAGLVAQHVVREPPVKWKPRTHWCRSTMVVDGERRRVLVGMVRGFRD